MRRTLSVIFVLLLALSLNASSTDDEGVYSFDDLRSSLSYGNVDLRKQDQVIYGAELDRAEAIGAYTPSIKLSLMGMYMTNPILDDFTIDIKDYVPGFPTMPIKLFDDMENDLYMFSLSFTQPILTGGKITNAYIMLDNVLSLRKLERKDKEESLSVELEGYLASLYYLKNIEENLYRMDEISSILLQMAGKGYESGMSTELEYLSRKMESEEIEFSIKDVETNVENIISSIHSLTGVSIPSADNISYIPDEERFKSIYEVGEAELLSMALSPSRSTMRMLDGAISVADKLKDLRLSGMYGVPDVALQVSLTYGGQRFPFVEKNWMNENEFGVNVALALNTTLWDGGKILNDVKRAESQKESALLDKESAVRTIEETVEKGYRAMSVSYSRLDYLLSKSALLESEYQDIQRKVDEGYSSEMDLYTKEIEMLQNEIEIQRKKIDIAVSAFTLSYLAGV